MAALSEYTNVYNTALVVLSRKGYQLWYEAKSNEYCAEKNGWDFRSRSPCGLLGVVTIFEEKRPTECTDYWWREREPKLYGSLPDGPPRPYRPVWER